MIGDGDSRSDELRLAELAATEGPVFGLWRVPAGRVTEVMAQLAACRVRHLLSAEGDLVVHRNDDAAARRIVAEVCGPDLEVTPARRDETSTTRPVDLVTAYTAGNLHQANLVLARLRSAGVESVLAYDAALGVAAHLAKDATVKVKVAATDLDRARTELGGQELDLGSDLPFRSQAWATPMRRLGARSLLLALGLFVLPILIVVAVVLYEFVAP